jgi:lysozyme
MILGIDVSHWQGVIDWSKVSRAGYRFAFCKATEATYYKDATYPRNTNEAQANGLLAGAYHFFRPRYSGYAQAEWFLKYALPAPGDLIPVCDFEVADGVAPSIIRSRLREFYLRIEAELGVKPIMYSRKYFLDQYLPGPPSWCSDVLLWVANYTTASKPLMPKGWQFWAFWQYSQSGKVPGVKTNTDLDRFHATDDKLQECRLK